MNEHMVRVTYDGNRHNIRPGDVIAFAGLGGFSWIIKKFTWSRVSHVGVVLGVDEHSLLLIIESTTLHEGKSGVQTNRLSDVVRSYKGNVWHLPLKDENSSRIASSDYFQYMKNLEGKPYGKWAAVKSAIPIYGKSQSKALFCSQLVGKLFRHVDIFHEDVNPAELTPIDICRASIYKSRYYQLKGKPTKIKSFNAEMSLVADPPKDHFDL